MTELTVVDEPTVVGTQTQSEMDEAILALRSGAWLTVAGVLMLAVALVFNQLGPEAYRLPAPPLVWALLGIVLAVQSSAVAIVELGQGWIRRHISVHGLYRYLWSSSMLEGIALAAGVVLVPAALVQLSLMTLMMVVFAGYFYRQWEAFSFIGFAIVLNTIAVLVATPPETPQPLFTAAALIPIAGVTAMAGGFVALVRRGRDRVERHARIVATVGLAKALDLRDGYTADHSETVGDYAARMATELGLSPRRIERVRLAGVVHDVGKIGIPDAVLLKPGKLSDAEWEQMRRHPELGAQMLDSTTLRDVRRWVLAHHERPDGKGYPAGLSGDAIPLEARILSVADAFEAMTADRVYRAGMPIEAAIAELHRCSGTQFDPQVVAAFIAALEAGGEAVVPSRSQAAAS